MTRAILLCAGFGTRLGTLSDDRPKPMLPVCDIAIVRYGVALLAYHGIREIVINLHHRGDTIERELGHGQDLGVSIQYSHEREILGTGGGIKHALPLLDPAGDDEPIISLNGKLIFDLDIPALLRAYHAAGDTLGMMVVRQVPDALEWGAVEVMHEPGQTPEVRDILGQGRHMFCGVHVTRPSVMRRLPDGEACAVRQGYLPWIREGGRVTAFLADDGGYFAEHSTPERYVHSNLALLRGQRLRFASDPGRGLLPNVFSGVSERARLGVAVQIRSPVYIGEHAIIGDRAIIGPDAIIGRGARVDAGVRVEGSVVWAGSHVRAHALGCIVTPHGMVTV